MAVTEVPPARTVADIMSHPVVTATADETIAKAAARMREQRVGSVVVVEGERPVGIMTERDMIRVAADGIDTATVHVADAMTRDPDSVSSDEEVAAAFASLAEHGYRHIPVVDDG